MSVEYKTILLRRGNKSDFESNKARLKSGEIALVTDDEKLYAVFKAGNPVEIAKLSEVKELIAGINPGGNNGSTVTDDHINSLINDKIINKIGYAELSGHHTLRFYGDATKEKLITTVALPTSDGSQSGIEIVPLTASTKEDNTIVIKGNAVGVGLEDWTDMYVVDALEDWTDKEL